MNGGVRYAGSAHRGWLTVVIALLLALMLWQSLALSPVAGWIPRLVLACTLVLALAQCVIDWSAAPDSGRAGEVAGESKRRRRALSGVAWIGGLLAATVVFGIVAGSVLFCLSWLRWHANEHWSVSLSLAAGLGMVLWLAFGVLLGVRLFPGLLTVPAF